MVAKVLLALLTVLSLLYQPSGSYLSNHCKNKDFGYFELCSLEMSSTHLMSLGYLQTILQMPADSKSSHVIHPSPNPDDKLHVGNYQGLNARVQHSVLTYCH